MNTNPLVSIIVPAYNSEKYIDECILSILNNTYKNIEIIVINDGSTDKTAEHMQKLKGKYSNIIVHTKQNEGLSAARNDGIKLSNGEIIGFVDSDDIVDKTYITKLISPILSDGADFSYCLFERFKYVIPSHSEYSCSHNIIQTKNEYIKNDNHIEKVISCAKLFRKNIFIRMKFDVGRYHEDEFVYNKLIKDDNVQTIGFIAEKLYFYRENQEGIMLSVNKIDQKKFDALDSLFERLSILKQFLNKKSVEVQKVMDDILQIVTSNNWEHPFGFKRIHYIRKAFLKGILYSKRIKKRIKFLLGFIIPVIYMIHFFPLFRSNIINQFKLKIANKKTIIYLGSITHGNLGDHAIFMGAKKFLSNNGYKLIDLTKEELTADLINLIKRKNFVLGLRGGGNIGNVWINEEEFHRSVIRTFKTNKIFFFPESVFFTNNQEGAIEKNVSSKIYAENDNLTIFLRDYLSIERGKTIFSNKIIFCPDMALYLKKYYYSPQKWSKCLIILRNDRESNTSSDLKGRIEELLKKHNIEFDYGSTIGREYISKKNRKHEVHKFLNYIRKYDFIITDRLHGMILSYDVGVPCLVIDNNNGKVKSAAQLLESSKIIFCLKTDLFTDIEKTINLMQNTCEVKLDYKKKYSTILEIVKK